MFQEVEASRIVRRSADKVGRFVGFTHWPLLLPEK